MKNSHGLLIFYGGCADLMLFISVKSFFLSKTERFGLFSFCFFYSNLGLPIAKKIAKWTS